MCFIIPYAVFFRGIVQTNTVLYWHLVSDDVIVIECTLEQEWRHIAGRCLCRRSLQLSQLLLCVSAYVHV